MSAPTAATVDMSQEEAERITEQIVGRIDSISENYEVVMMLMRDALARNAHSVLGYASPGLYIKERFGQALTALSASIRREFVHELSDAGLSTRAIAPVFGVSHMSIQRDIEAGVTPVTPEPPVSTSPEVVEPEWEPGVAVNAETGEVTEPGESLPTVTEHTLSEKTKTTVGLDGKTYKSTPPAERRSSILDDARNAGWQLRKAVERLERIQSDDRFTKNKAEILAALQPHLDFANEVFADL